MGLGRAAEAQPDAANDIPAGTDNQSLQKKGFVVTSVDNVMNWARTG